MHELKEPPLFKFSNKRELTDQLPNNLPQPLEISGDFVSGFEAIRYLKRERLAGYLLILLSNISVGSHPSCMLPVSSNGCYLRTAGIVPASVNHGGW